MNNLIFDEFNSSLRLKNSINMNLVITSEDNIEDNFYNISSMYCCSGVRETDKNWFYVVNNLSNEDIILKWINEINPIFPELDIKVIYVDSSKLEIYGLIEDGDITVNLPLSDYTYTYGITNKSRYPRGDFYRFSKLSGGALDYISKSFKRTGDKICTQSITTLIEEFFSSKVFLNIKEDMFKRNLDNFSNHSDNIIMRIPSEGDFNIALRSVDYTDPEVEDLLKKYIKKVILTNGIEYIKRRTGNTYKVMCIQALYSHSNKYLLKYIAHVLIRAIFAMESIEFVKQYFYIKEKTPNLYFWNRIFLTQFGFNFNNYFWLTSWRTFRFITEEEFIRESNNDNNERANSFFSKFEVSYCNKILNKLKELYLSDNFDSFIKMYFNSPEVVKLKDEYKNKFINLRLSKEYITTISDEKDYYLIVGDDYKMRKYRKDRFL